ncbi:GFA family protein [Rhodanobacter sp. FW106-PBR-R2A-1-13]|uniref:GFA family protein n=1 Tax=Rhodanobacter sp. FW106-PBR-R2A-1-13 TaxID=3454845 RepID=UPI003F714771
MSGSPMHRLEGGCHCGNIRIVVDLPNAPSDYFPRACDCEFCRKHGASYVSDPHGSLRIEVGNSQFLVRYRQGSEIAECLFCSRCGVLIGVLYQESSHLYATVNSAVLVSAESFGEKKSVSPKQLTANEKVGRWMELWFSNVTLAANDA